jgi:hypothetical protein
MAPPATQQPDLFGSAFDQATGQQTAPAQTDPFSSAFDAATGAATSSQQQPQQPAPDYLTKTEDFIHNAATGVAQGAGDVWGAVKGMVSNIPGVTQSPVDTAKGIWHALPPVQLYDTTKQALPVINAYEKARAGGASITDAIKAADTQAKTQDTTVQKVQQVAADFRKNPTQETARALTDAAALAASMWAGGEVAAGAEAGEATMAPEAETAAEAEATTAKTAATKPGLVASDTGTANATEQAALTPKEQAVSAGTAKAAKAGISEGTAETVAPRVEGIQPQLHQGVRDFINQTAKTAGLEPIPDSTPITDVPQNLADAFQERSQATFDKVEEITGVNPTTLKQQMAARTDQITEAAAGGDLEKAGKLEMLQKADENRAIQAFNQAKAQNVDVNQARSDWNASLRTDELSAAVRGSKANTSTLRNPVLDPSKLAPRLQKLAEGQPGGKASKLFQLGGQDNANALVEHAENAREATQAIKNFTPTSATGQKLLAQLQANNTVEKSSLLRGGNVVAKTDWNGVVKDIGNLAPEQQAALGDDFPRMRQLAGKLAARQNAMDWITGTTTAGKMVRGALAEELVRRTF